MPAVKLGMGAPMMPGMPAPMGAPMGGPMGGMAPPAGMPPMGAAMPPMQAPMPGMQPPMGAPMQPPMQPMMGNAQQASAFQGYVMGAPRRRRFGDFLERTLSYRGPSGTSETMGQMDVFTGQMPRGSGVVGMESGGDPLLAQRQALLAQRQARREARREEFRARRDQRDALTAERDAQRVAQRQQKNADMAALQRERVQDRLSFLNPNQAPVVDPLAGPDLYPQPIGTPDWAVPKAPDIAGVAERPIGTPPWAVPQLPYTGAAFDPTLYGNTSGSPQTPYGYNYGPAYGSLYSYGSSVPGYGSQANPYASSMLTYPQYATNQYGSAVRGYAPGGAVGPGGTTLSDVSRSRMATPSAATPIVEDIRRMTIDGRPAIEVLAEQGYNTGYVKPSAPAATSAPAVSRQTPSVDASTPDFAPYVPAGDYGGDSVSEGYGGSVSPEARSLFGPSLNMPNRSSGGDGMGFGLGSPSIFEMTAVSPIGSLNLPKRTAPFTLLDYLSEPVYGSLSPTNMAKGGMVNAPKQADIKGQGHMLAYITPKEAGILKGLGGWGGPGPKGIPSFPENAAAEGGFGLSADAAFGGGKSGGSSSGGQGSTSGGGGSDSGQAAGGQGAGSYGGGADRGGGGYFDSFGNEYSSASAAATADAVAEAAAAAVSGGGGGVSGARDADMGIGMGNTVSVADYTSGNVTSTPSSGGGGGRTVTARSEPTAFYDAFGNQFSTQTAANMSDLQNSLSAINAPTGVGTYQSPSPVSDLQGYLGRTGVLSDTSGAQGGLFGSGLDLAPSNVAPSGISAMQDSALSRSPLSSGLGSLSMDTVPNATSLSQPSSDVMSAANMMGTMEATGAMQDIANAVNGMISRGEEVSVFDIEDNAINAISRSTGYDPGLVQGVVSQMQQQEAFGPVSASPTVSTGVSYEDTSAPVVTGARNTQQTLANIAKQYEQYRTVPNQRTSQMISSALEDLFGGKITAEKMAQIAPVMDQIRAGKSASEIDLSSITDPTLMEQIAGTFLNTLTFGIVNPNLAENRVTNALDFFDAYLEQGEKGGPTSIDRGSDFYDERYDPYMTDQQQIDDTRGGGDGADRTTDTTTTGPGYTTDDSGNIVCDQEGYVYDPVEKKCVPAAPTEGSVALNAGRRGLDFADTYVTSPQVTIAPISANIKPMAVGGMAGLNRAADAFLRSMAG